MSASGYRKPVGLLGYAMNTIAGFSTAMRATKASASKVKSARSGTATAFMPLKRALTPYMTKLGDGYITAAPGRASAVIMICSSSSEPLPSKSFMPAGTAMRCASASSSFCGLGVG